MFGIFYTGTIGAGALTPILYGVIGDMLGVTVALMVIAALVLATLPLVLAIRSKLAPA